MKILIEIHTDKMPQKNIELNTLCKEDRWQRIKEFEINEKKSIYDDLLLLLLLL